MSRSGTDSFTERVKSARAPLKLQERASERFGLRRTVETVDEVERVADEDLIYQALHMALFAASWTLSWGES